MRSVSLAVDITNYVMLDLGQPMHAYDLGALAAPIVVRRARADETLVTLDEEKRELDEQDLLITDSPHAHGSRIIGIAGVMGGAYSEVGDSTTDILFEAAQAALRGSQALRAGNRPRPAGARRAARR